jgi:N-acetylglucosaminyl-diphospho-decaprenol L-rhamnosyltransferase
VNAALVPAVVVNLDGGDMLEKCLDALPAAGASEIVVVDNGSSRGELDRLESRPGVRLIRLTQNEGFARPANRGEAIAEAASPFVAFVNNDCTLERGYITACAAALGADPGLAAVQGVILDGNGERVDGCGIGWTARAEAVQLMRGEVPPPPAAGVFSVPGVSATAAVYRRDSFRAAGGFEESFFAWYEDVDLALRLTRAGGRFACVPAARARHLGSATGCRAPALKWKHLFENRIRTLRRNLAPWTRTRTLLAGTLEGTALRDAARDLGWPCAVATVLAAIGNAAAARHRDLEVLTTLPPLTKLPR